MHLNRREMEVTALLGRSTLCLVKAKAAPAAVVDLTAVTYVFCAGVYVGRLPFLMGEFEGY